MILQEEFKKNGYISILEEKEINILGKLEN